MKQPPQQKMANQCKKELILNTAEWSFVKTSPWNSHHYLLLVIIKSQNTFLFSGPFVRRFVEKDQSGMNNIGE